MTRTAILIAMMLAAAPASAADWPQWLGPNRDGVSPETTRLADRPDPKEIWRASVGLGPSSPVVAGGRCCVMGYTGGLEDPHGTDTVWCLDAETGEIVWKHSYDCKGCESQDVKFAGPRATPTVDGNAVYTLSLMGQLFCLDAATGKVLWSKDLVKDLGGKVPGFYGYCCSPLVYAEKLILEVNSKGGDYVALDKATGKVLWQASANRATCASPVLTEIDGAPCVLFVSANTLCGIDPAMGRQLWSQGLPWIHWMGPGAVSGNKVFVSSASLSRGCALVRIEKNKPLIVWQDQKKFQTLHCNAVYWKGHLYGFDNRGTDYSKQDDKKSSLKCLDFATGEEKWSRAGMGWGNLILADDKLIVLRESGEVVVAEATPAEYRERSRTPVLRGPCWTVPALAGGRLYLRSNAGDVVCLDVRAP
jgi:outer membrane protein assembly factor BamB